ncbi:uncharacterized protein hdly isoform X2 [Euwallacea similis]|uniref:uncharacterized protein hdly isoform X2 n=1 Tax=Euwallacea similis TaxID=1736056 RepID=UPI00344D5B7A
MKMFLKCLTVVGFHLMALQGVYSLDKSGSRVRKRSYNPWAVPVALNSISVYDAAKYFKPASHSISPPYYIPVYGAVGGSYIFYPPQQIYTNPGVPADNPSGTKEYQAPNYLPPNRVGVVNRVGGFDEYDDAPIWGTSKPPVVQMPLSGGQQKEYSLSPIPTRRPGASTPQRPPLVHEVTQGSTRKQLSTTPQPPSGPSNCVWAIVSCCSATSPTSTPHNCFEQRGCPGPFWGNSPCGGEFARAAIAAAVQYYDKNDAAAGK